MFKNQGFFEELLKKLLNDFAASRRKLLNKNASKTRIFDEFPCCF